MGSTKAAEDAEDHGQHDTLAELQTQHEQALSEANAREARAWNVAQE